MKSKIRKFFLSFLLLFSYPQKLADAVNRAATPEEFDKLLESNWSRDGIHK